MSASGIPDLMKNLFFYGSLRDEALLRIVLGSDASVRMTQATLADHEVVWADGRAFPMIQSRQGAIAEGLLVEGLTNDQIARLNFYEGGFAYDLVPFQVQTEHGLHPCEIYWPPKGQFNAGSPWKLEDWQRDFGPMSREAAKEVMSHFGSMDAQTLAQHFPRIRARADSRVRAKASSAPSSVRSEVTEGALVVEKTTRSHLGFYALDTMLLRHRKFDGEMSDVLRREVFISSDASIVLPYDPRTDQVLMVEQFRMGPTGRNDPLPWCLEPVAGLIDPGETPEETAHREAFEEAGIRFSSLETVANGYSSPGASTGYFFLYVGLCDLNGHNSEAGGIMDEGEDIRSHIFGFDKAMELVDSGEINVLPTILCLNWLARHREQLRSLA